MMLDTNKQNKLDIQTKRVKYNNNGAIRGGSYKVIVGIPTLFCNLFF